MDRNPKKTLKRSESFHHVSRQQRENYWSTVLTDEPGDNSGNRRGSSSTSNQAQVIRPRAESDGEYTDLNPRQRDQQGARRDLSRSSRPPSGAGASSSINTAEGSNRHGIASGRREAPCPQCHVLFKRKYDLLQHISAVHEKNKPFKCDICDNSFGHKGTLSKHVRTVHRRERPYECEHCGLRFSERGNVNKHKQRSASCRDAERRRGSASNSSK